MRTLLFLGAACFCLTACQPKANKTETVENEEWVSLLNGENLNDWTVKITGYPAGENFGNTFRMEDGMMKVRYDGYDSFNERYGHIFYNKKKFSHYKLRVEYRFVGEQVNEGPGWAYRNSGAMLHCQSPESMHLDQDFPVSIEAQFLGGDGTGDRPTGSVCTPGTEVSLEGEPYKGHCASSTSHTFDGDQWVTIEMIVLGDSIAHHVVAGDTIMTYTNIAVGGGNVSPKPNIPDGPLKEGYISLQSESHPVDFRKVEILDLSKQYK